MNIYPTDRDGKSDCKLCVASIAGVYAPLLLILAAAVVVF